MDGEGHPPSPLAGQLAGRVLEESGEVGERLRLYPTLEGGLLLEAQQDERRWSLEIEADGSLQLVLAESALALTLTPLDLQEVGESLRELFPPRAQG